MPSKSQTDKSSSYGDSDDTYVTLRRVSLEVVFEGDPPGPGDWLFLTVFNGQIVLDGKWRDGAVLKTESLPLDLSEASHQSLVTQKPLILLLRITGGKGSRDPDPLLNLDNRAGATVDLLPLIIGEDKICIRVPLLDVDTGRPTKCIVNVSAFTSPVSEELTTVPLVMTMISAHCLPVAKENTYYIGAICLDRVLNRAAVQFGVSLSFADAEKTVWATASNGGQMANTAFSVPDEDKFVPEDFSLQNEKECRSFYWNAMNRVLVDPKLLRERLSSPFLFELAGVPRMGKVDVRGRYLAFVDAGVLLQPGESGVTVCAKLLFYNERALPEHIGALLDLPPTSAKPQSARETEFVFDEYDHNAYIVLRFDLWDPLAQKIKTAALFDTIGLMPPGGPAAPIDLLDVDIHLNDTTIDVRKIRKESGALAVHKELSSLACRGAIPMNQGIKRTAAHHLLIRVRSMLKQFPPGNCLSIERQDIVTAQHAACRRAVTSSFAPQPPPVHPTARLAAARARMAGDYKISDAHTKANLIFSDGNPRALICSALRCLEELNDLDANNYILEGLSAQPRNRFLLWIYGAQEFDKGVEAKEMAAAAFHIAVKGDNSDGTVNTIGWAALHTLYHFNEDPYSAFVAVNKMRMFNELPGEWKKFLQRWIHESGEEETFWIPASIDSFNPLLITAAFFLCLRCYKFCEKIMCCVEKGCATSGNRFGYKHKIGPDINYVRAASFVLQRQFDKALKVTKEGVKKFGPNPLLSQMRAMILTCTRGWDEECNRALEYADRAGGEPSPTLLIRAALGGININPEVALQRAARAHKIAPCGHSALVIGRIYAKMNELSLAERWAAVAVKCEPLLADGWAVLSILAMYEQNFDKARTMVRTANQIGPLNPDIQEELKKVMGMVKLERLPESLVKNLCLCDYY